VRAWLSVLFVLPLAACGGGGDEPTPQADETSAVASGVPARTAGTFDPLAITSFTCRQDEAGRWEVRGTLENSGPRSRDYRLTVFIGQQTGPARTLDLDRVKAGSTVPFTVDPVVAAPDGPCRLQAAVVH
jgi:hypothetical protein